VPSSLFPSKGVAPLSSSSMKWDDFIELDIIDDWRTASNMMGNNLPLECWSCFFDKVLRVFAIVHWCSK
jgi:hypothetical protein